MKNILFPTDFTELSLNAFKYAMDYAQKFGYKLIVYHTYMEGSSIKEETQAVYNAVDVQNFRNKKDKFPPFEELIQKSKLGHLNVKYIVEQGTFVNSLMNYVSKKEDKIDLIIMGTQGNSKSLFNIFMETQTLKILKEISMPVIAIPERAYFDGSLDRIAFLVDYRNDEIKPLETLIERTREFGADLHVIHFDLAHGESIVPLMEGFKNSLRLAQVKDVNFVSIDSIDLKKSLNKYCREHSIDLVCLINHRRNSYQRLFSFSLAEDLISNVDIPIMAVYSE